MVVVFRLGLALLFKSSAFLGLGKELVWSVYVPKLILALRWFLYISQPLMGASGCRGFKWAWVIVAGPNKVMKWVLCVQWLRLAVTGLGLGLQSLSQSLSIAHKWAVVID
ncbi:hypothetical protein Tco_1201980 [Tanacetum coccineum]